MKKFLLTFLMILASVLVLKAGVLNDYYNKNVRTATKMVQDATPEMLAEDGMKAASQAALTPETANKLLSSAKFAAPVKLVKELNQNGAVAKIWTLPAGDNSEMLIIMTSPQGSAAVFTAAPEAVINQALQQMK